MIVVGIPAQPTDWETLSRKARMLVLSCARHLPLLTSSGVPAISLRISAATASGRARVEITVS